ncbi:VanZ family protein [Polaribacter sp. IC073]|nr:VanZ family protein [Polaribacter sp. IC073]
MLKHIKTLFKGKLLIIAIVITISILYLSLMRVPKYDISISHLDKWQHCLAYFTLSLSWLFAVYKENKKYLIVFACVVFGIIIEILQHTLTNYRTGDYFDVIANSLGVLIGLLVYNQVFKKNLLK